MAEVFANSEDPDQMPHSAASDLGLHCLPVTLLGVSRLQWVKCNTPIFSVTIGSRSLSKNLQKPFIHPSFLACIKINFCHGFHSYLKYLYR